MIELPEAVALARQIKETLLGKKIVNVVANASPHKFAWFTPAPEDFPGLLVSKTIRDTSSSGHHVEIHIDDRLLVISTPIKYHPAGEKPPKKHQLLITFEDQSFISCTVQMWGGLLCYPQNDIGDTEYYQMARQAPSPLSGDFDRAHFDGLFTEGWEKLSAKAFLATEQRIPGLGNGVLQDILWTARIHPKRKLGKLSQQEIREIFNAVKSVLGAMASQGGRDTEKDLFGQPGGYRTVLSSKTASQLCPNCGSAICKEAYLGGSIYYCPTCQPL
jgi:formamidopyrimidine-DNA glycosylase